VNGAPADVVAAKLTLAGVQAASDIDAQLRHAVGAAN
jgi:hypothetical protein